MIRNVDFITEFNRDLHDSGYDVSMIHGAVSVEKRTLIKDNIESGSGKILLATVGTFSMGENVKNLSSLILTQSRKSEIEIIQQIGRLLRKHDNKEKAQIFDIVDDLVVETTTDTGTTRKSFGKRHMKNRIKAFKTHKLNVKDIEFVKI